LRVQESSVKKSASSVLKVHDDSVLHLIDTYNLRIHVDIVILFPVNVSPTPNLWNRHLGVADEWCKLSAVPQGNYRVAMQDDAVKSYVKTTFSTAFYDS
jgi:hypothetical protein